MLVSWPLHVVCHLHLLEQIALHDPLRNPLLDNDDCTLDAISTLFDAISTLLAARFRIFSETLNGRLPLNERSNFC